MLALGAVLVPKRAKIPSRVGAIDFIRSAAIKEDIEKANAVLDSQFLPKVETLMNPALAPEQLVVERIAKLKEFLVQECQRDLIQL